MARFGPGIGPGQWGELRAGGGGGPGPELQCDLEPAYCAPPNSFEPEARVPAGLRRETGMRKVSMALAMGWGSLAWSLALGASGSEGMPGMPLIQPTKSYPVRTDRQ